MNTLEEKLWDFIDGNCSAEEHAAIAHLIETDKVYRLKYEELLAFNADMGNLEIDEPSMGFNFKVMDAIRTEMAHAPLKASINKNVIRAFVGFFIVVILALISYTFTTINWSEPATTGINLKLPEIKMPASISSLLLKGFFFFDLVLALYFGDAYLRKIRITR